MSDTQKYWFPAKQYGWGWGIPAVWQGWLVLFGFIVLQSGGALVLEPQNNRLGFSAYTALLCLVLLAICWIKGEPPRWRWGGK